MRGGLQRSGGESGRLYQHPESWIPCEGEKQQHRRAGSGDIVELLDGDIICERLVGAAEKKRLQSVVDAWVLAELCFVGLTLITNSRWAYWSSLVRRT